MYTLTISGIALPINSRADLSNLSTLELVLGYNNLTGKKIKGFHTKAKGEDQIWNLLAKQSPQDLPVPQAQEPEVNEQGQPETQPQPKEEDMATKAKTKKAKARKSVKPVHGATKVKVNRTETPKCAEPKEVKRETARMGLIIRKVKDHPGKGLRVKRWDRYRDGMTIKKVIEMDNGDPRDINFFVANKLMKLEKPSEK